MTQATLIKYAVIVLVCFGLGYATRNYMANAQTTKRDLAEVKELNTKLAAANQAIEARDTKNRELNGELNVLAFTSTRKQNEQLVENSALRTDLNVLRSLRLKGSSCPVATQTGQTSSSGVLVDATEVGISAETGQLVFDLRADIIADGAKIDYLQGYIRALGLDDPSKPIE